MDEDRLRFEQLYRAHAGRILAYAARRTTTASDAMDVVAETFTVAWRRIADVPPGDEARPWLYGVAARVLANHHRGARRRHQLCARLSGEVVDLVEQAAADSDGPNREAIATAFAGLSDADRELLTLVGWDGLGHAEVAAIVGCSRAAVRVRLHRARRRFAQLLEAAGVTRPAASGHEDGRWATVRLDPEEA